MQKHIQGIQSKTQTQARLNNELKEKMTSIIEKNL